MTDHKFFHIYLRPKLGVTQEQIVVKMNSFTDWFSYNAYDWIVYAATDTQDLWLTLKPFVDPGGTTFICEFNPQTVTGFMSKSLWQWLQKPR